MRAPFFSPAARARPLSGSVSEKRVARSTRLALGARAIHESQMRALSAMIFAACLFATVARADATAPKSVAIAFLPSVPPARRAALLDAIRAQLVDLPVRVVEAPAAASDGGART